LYVGNEFLSSAVESNLAHGWLAGLIWTWI